MNTTRNAAALLAVLALSLLGIGRAKADSTPVTCGDVITAPGKYYLSGDCTGAGIQINASNFDLNLAGHTLTAGDPSVVGVYVSGGSNVRVHDGTLTQVRGGVYMDGTTGCLVDHVTVQFPVHRGESAFSVFNGGSKNRIDSCQALQGAGYEVYYLISIFGPADGNVISNNLVDGGLVGIDLDGASNTTVKGNTVKNAEYAIYDWSGPNTITQNTTWDCGVAVGMENAFGTVVRDNTFSSQFFGFLVLGGGSNRLVHNSCSGSPGFYGTVGIWLGWDTTNNRVEGNTCSAYWYGINIDYGSTGNVIQYNTAINNYIWDLEDDNPGPPLPNTWMNNTFGTTNQPGLIN